MNLNCEQWGNIPLSPRKMPRLRKPRVMNCFGCCGDLYVPRMDIRGGGGGHPPPPRSSILPPPEPPPPPDTHPNEYPFVFTKFKVQNGMSHGHFLRYALFSLQTAANVCKRTCLSLICSSHTHSQC